MPFFRLGCIMKPGRTTGIVLIIMGIAMAATGGFSFDKGTSFRHNVGLASVHKGFA